MKGISVLDFYFILKKQQRPRVGWRKQAHHRRWRWERKVRGLLIRLLRRNRSGFADTRLLYG
jgi:hypothetical protein